MTRKKKAPSGPNNSYLISFGDTMTALLAFFIVLNSLATEQTGANLHSGTGSFMQTGKTMGVPGLFARGLSTNAVQLDEPSPLYIVNEDGSESEDSGSNGPDEDGDTRTVRDREQDQLQRFLEEMQSMHNARQKDSIAGEIAFDVMRPISKSGPVSEEMQEQFLRLAPLMRRQGYELEIRVWATTPSPSAWQRAVVQADRLHKAVVAFLQLSEKQTKRVRATASPWHTSNVARPAVSFFVRRLSE